MQKVGRPLEQVQCSLGVKGDYLNFNFLEKSSWIQNNDFFFSPGDNPFQSLQAVVSDIFHSSKVIIYHS